MKKIIVKYVGLAILLGLIYSCSEVQQEIPERVDGETDIVFRTELLEGTSVNSLQTKLYVFSNDGTDGYQLTDSLSQVVSGLTRLTLKLADLNRNDYRFLFISTPMLNPEIQARCNDGSPFAFGTGWDKVAVAMLADSLSVDNYYGITDLSGSQILQMETIHGELTRLVGQMVFCFYKIGEGGIKDRVPVNDPTVLSVMDRISSIKIDYEGVSRLVTFDAALQPVPFPEAKASIQHTIRFSQEEDGLKVNLPQPGIPVEMSDSIIGGAIVKGACLLPSQQGIRVSMAFEYYDTTPTCLHSEDTHVHEPICYKLQALSLMLPKQAEQKGLSVRSDHFTINNVGLPCNRVIDVSHQSVIEINTVWN